jgi:uncharacterized protein
MTVSPFLIPMHDLINKPGQMKELDLEIVVAEPLGVGAISVVTGSIIDVSARFESVHEGILATGEVDADAEGQCSRCLDPIKLVVEVDFQELFAYSGTEEDEFLVQDDQIDLEQVIRDAVVLSLPFQPVCSADCLGLCPECGVKLAEDPNHVHDVLIDSRWNELKKLKEE